MGAHRSDIYLTSDMKNLIFSIILGCALGAHLSPSTASNKIVSWPIDKKFHIENVFKYVEQDANDASGLADLLKYQLVMNYHNLKAELMNKKKEVRTASKKLDKFIDQHKHIFDDALKMVQKALEGKKEELEEFKEQLKECLEQKKEEAEEAADELKEFVQDHKKLLDNGD